MLAGSVYLNFVLVVCLELAFCQHYVGDLCTLQSTGESGQCQLIENCPCAIHEFHSQGLYPQNCGFQDQTPIVCCVQNKFQHTDVPLNEGEVYAGTKSQQKCEEYGRYTFVESSLSMLSDLQYTAMCPFPSVEFTPRYTAKPRELPHMAAIGFDDQNNKKVWRCSGSLISERFVLTAAHCLHQQILDEPKYIRLGDLTLNSDADEANPQDFNIIQRISHPLYKPQSKYYDIALLKINRDAQFNSYVKPACLNTSPTLTTRIAIVSGWKKAADSEVQSLTLAKLKYSAYTECNNSYAGTNGLSKGVLEKAQICASSDDSCQSDSGGPLQIYNNLEANCTYKIIGVTSIPKPCDDTTVPGVYTRVSKHIEWIENIVWP